MNTLAQLTEAFNRVYVPLGARALFELGAPGLPWVSAGIMLTVTRGGRAAALFYPPRDTQFLVTADTDTLAKVAESGWRAMERVLSGPVGDA